MGVRVDGPVRPRTAALQPLGSHTLSPQTCRRLIRHQRNHIGHRKPVRDRSAPTQSARGREPLRRQQSSRLLSGGWYLLLIVAPAVERTTEPTRHHASLGREPRATHNLLRQNPGEPSVPLPIRNGGWTLKGAPGTVALNIRGTPRAPNLAEPHRSRTCRGTHAVKARQLSLRRFASRDEG